MKHVSFYTTMCILRFLRIIPIAQMEVRQGVLLAGGLLATLT